MCWHKPDDSLKYVPAHDAISICAAGTFTKYVPVHMSQLAHVPAHFCECAGWFIKLCRHMTQFERKAYPSPPLQTLLLSYANPYCPSCTRGLSSAACRVLLRRTRLRRFTNRQLCRQQHQRQLLLLSSVVRQCLRINNKANQRKTHALYYLVFARGATGATLRLHRRSITPFRRSCAMQ